MKFPFFASFVVFCIWFWYERRKHTKIDEKREESFWEREERANSVRKRSLAGLHYITVPEDLIYNGLLNDDTYRSRCEDIDYLKTRKIVNLTGYTNTDLKLEYGTANITVLSEYDQNYTRLVSTLQLLAQQLYDAGLRKEAQDLLEYAVSTGTDVSGTYYLLADIYYENGTPERVDELIAAAENIRSILKNSIIKRLSEDPLFKPVQAQQ